MKRLAVSRIGAVPITLDGKDDEPSWSVADRQGQFVQTDPDEGAEPTEQTYVRVVRDADALYFFIEAHYRDPSDARALLTQRDLWSMSDWVRFS